MFRKNWIRISITLVIAIFLIAQAGLTQEMTSPKSLRNVTPDKPLIFFQLTGVSSIISKDSNFWKQLEQAPFWELIYAEMEAKSEVKDVQLAIEPGVSLLSYIFGEDIVFVFPQFKQITQVSPLLMLRLKDGDDALSKIIANGIKVALANVAETTSQYGGYTIATIPLPEGDMPLKLSCGLLGDVFAVSLGDTMLKRVIDLMNGSENAKAITEDVAFSSVMERFPLPANSKTGQYLTVFYLNVAQIVDFANMFYPFAQENIPQEARPIVEKMLKWFDLIPSISSVVSITDEGPFSQEYVALNPDATSQNFLKMLQTEPEQLGSIKFAPEDAIGYNGSNLVDLKSVWKMVHDTLSDFPQIREQALGQLEQLQQQLQFDFEEGLLSWMGNEIAFIYNENPTFSEEYISKEICVIFEVTDMEKASQGMRNFTEIGVRLSEGEMTIQPQEYMGKTIYELGHLPVPVKLAYVLVDDYLLISPSVEYLQKLIDCAAGRRKNLEANLRFQSIKDGLPEKVNRIEFFDARTFAKSIIDSIKAQMGGEIPTWDDEDLDVGKTVILQAFELANLLSQAFKASISFTVNDRSGLKSTSFMKTKDLEDIVPINDPDPAKIARNLYIANLYRDADMLNKALSRYAQVLEIDEDNWQAVMGAAQIVEKQGKTQQAKEYWARTGFVPEDIWYVIGPFENEIAEGFYTEYPPEENIQLDAEYEGKDGIVKWEKRTDRTHDGFIDLQDMFDDNQWAVAYALTKVISKETREVELRVGSDDQIKVWLNGEEVFGHEIPRTAQPDQNVIPVTLNEGENQLLIKVCNEEMDWGFYLRFTDFDGKPLKDLEYGR